MTQQDVINLLKRNKCWMTTKEISEKLKVNSVNENLRRLEEQGLVQKIIRGYNLPIMWKIKSNY